MDALEFASALAAVLRLCRAAADEAPPIEGMLAHVEAERGREGADVEELDALDTIIRAVGDVAAIGARLPREPRLIQVPAAGGGIPLPSNLT
jgi:hypothetical protein